VRHRPTDAPRDWIRSASGSTRALCSP
jgi:hypothetical protein